jgi:streptomycin 6-kinase
LDIEIAQARVQVLPDQQQLGLLQGSLHGPNLLKYRQAGTILFDHPRHTTDVAFDALEPA